MHRFFQPPALIKAGRFFLEETEAHHALSVLRLDVDDRISVLDGEGNTYDCRIAEKSKKSVGVEILGRKFQPPAPLQITLIQSLPKGQLFESILEKSTELGVARIVPLLSERTTIRLGGEDKERKLSRWRQTVIESCKQSGQPWLPQLLQPATPAEFLATKPVFDLAIVGAIREDARIPLEVFQEFEIHRQRSAAPEIPLRVAVWIGPEGDFSPRELDLIVESGAHPLSFGNLILRCETAAVFALSMVRFYFGNLKKS